MNGVGIGSFGLGFELIGRRGPGPITPVMIAFSELQMVGIGDRLRRVVMPKFLANLPMMGIWCRIHSGPTLPYPTLHLQPYSSC